MADLKNERAQILLIAAFTLAVIFVGLAIVVNGAIFTQNLASQGLSNGGDALLLYRADMIQSFGETLDYVNEQGGNTSTKIEDQLTENLTQQGRRMRNYTHVNGRDISVNIVSTESGTYIEDQAGPPNDFQGDDSGADWRIGSNVGAIRKMRFYVQDATAEVGSGNEFTLLVSGTTGQLYTLRIGNNTSMSTQRPMLEVTGTGRAPGTCTLVSQTYPVRLDVMNARFGGRYCHALDRIEIDDITSKPRTIDIENGDTLFGNYSLIVRSISLDSEEYDSRSSDAPFNKVALYGIFLNLKVQTLDKTYEDRLWVAPGESDD